MSMLSPPIRLPLDVYDSAVAASRVASRTVPQQIAHWVRLGRELELSTQVNHRAISRTLAGTDSYDMLGEREQAIVRMHWTERATALREGLNYAAQFCAVGDSYSETDQDGNVVTRQPRD